MMCDEDEFKRFVIQTDNHRKTDGSASTANFINSGLGFVGSGYGAGGVHPTETAKIFEKILEQ